MGRLYFPQAMITLLTLMSLASSELYHIMSTDSHSLCTNHTNCSCMTLSQFASRYVASDDNTLTLVFSPGEHTLSQTIYISNVHNVTLIGDSEQPTIINYVSTFASFELTDISNILFVAYLNMRRDGQTVLSIGNVNSVFIKECQIVGTKYSHMPRTLSAVSINSALHVTIHKCNFKNCQILNLPETSPTHQLSTGSPALIIKYSYSVLVQKSSFTNNSVNTNNTSAISTGGAAYLGKIGLVALINCTMKNNTIACYRCQIAAGGAITLYHVHHLSVINSMYTKNGIISTLSLQVAESSKFTAGGAIYVENDPAKNTSDVIVSGSNFSHNFADLGGSIAITSTNIHILESRYICNVGRYGGAIFTIIVNNCSYHSFLNQFINNTAFFNGGAVLMHLNGSNTSYNSSHNKFISNFARRYSGAIGFEVFENDREYISSYNLFQNNTAENGGAIGLKYNNQNGSFCSSHNKFVDNKAKHFGGAIIVIQQKQNNTLTDFIVDDIYRNNIATEGGALHVIAQSFSIVNTNFF